MAEDITLEPIGVVHSSIPPCTDRKMPLYGTEAEIEIFDKYLDGLEGIEDKSHIFVLCWLHRSDRDILQVRLCRRFFPDGIVPEWVSARGVFASRSPARPNPISLSTTKILERNGNRLKVVLDVADGTPVLDIKPYSVGWDCIFSAVGGEGRFYGNTACYASLAKEAVNFHGEECAGLAVGVRIALKAITELKLNLRDPGLKIWARAGGCLIDTMQAVSGATLGNNRLSIDKVDGAGESVALSWGEEGIQFQVKPYSHLTPAEIAALDDDHLFTSLPL